MLNTTETRAFQPGQQIVELTGSLEDINDYFYQQGWTDGLPIIPPTPERVDRLLTGWPGDAQEEVAEVPPRMGVASVEAIAVNAVMAGCKPEYLPVVVAGGEGQKSMWIPTPGAQTLSVTEAIRA